jgi:hypothetical protein
MYMELAAFVLVIIFVSVIAKRLEDICDIQKRMLSEMQQQGDRQEKIETYLLKIERTLHHIDGQVGSDIFSVTDHLRHIDEKLLNIDTKVGEADMSVTGYLDLIDEKLLNINIEIVK